MRSCTRILSISASLAGAAACVVDWSRRRRSPGCYPCVLPPLSSGPSVGSRYRDTFDSPQREARGLSPTCSILGDRQLCEANGAAARPRAASRAHRSHKRGAKRPPVWELPKWRRGVGRNARRKRGVFLQVPQGYLRLVQLRRRYRVGCTLLCTGCYRAMCTIGQRRLFDSPQIGDEFEFFLFQSAFEY